MSVRILIGDTRARLRELPDESVHCCVCSPPYFGLRAYIPDGHKDKHLEIGLEDTPAAFVAVMVEVFREVRRVLRDDGTLWLNLGDSYANDSKWGGTTSGKHVTALHGDAGIGRRRQNTGLKSKDLIGIPWRVAFALQADGWYLRQDIIWSKPNPMPESVTDRCTKAHEYLFLLSKSARYHYDAAAIAEPAQDWTSGGPGTGILETQHYGAGNGGNGGLSKIAARYKNGEAPTTRNRRSVWTVATQPFSEAHFATFPPALIEPCILAGCPKDCCAKCGAPVVREVERTAMVLDRSDRTHELGRTRSSGTMLKPPTSKTTGWSPSCSCDAGTARGVVLDPFGGAGTTGLVADRHGRDAVLIELNPEYAAIARKRIHGDSTLFANVTVAA